MRAVNEAANDGMSVAADTWPLSAKEAASVLGISERTIRRAIARGDLPATLHAGVYRIAPADFARYRERRHVTAPLQNPAPFPTPRLIALPREASEAVTSLPVPLTSFVGREREVADVTGLLSRPEVRMVTLTGPGGVGKTRLAIATAAGLAAAFADGVQFIDLSTVTDPALVPSAIAGAVGVREGDHRPLIERLRAFLAPRETLLVLDNFEAVIAAGPSVASLLAACPGVKALVTSRALLRVSGEHGFPVPPLTPPDPTAQPAVLAACAAVQLFSDRARAVMPDFAVTGATAGAVAEVCRRLDGLPLAIELAAARSNLLSPAALLARLGQRLSLLAGGARDLPARQRSLRAVVAWSYDLLSADEQTAFRRLSVFVGGAFLDAAEAICAAAGVPDPLAMIASLVDRSLLHAGEEPAGHPRVAMLETVRDFALERLRAADDELSAREAHAAYYEALAERLNFRKKWTGQAAALAVLDVEHANLRAALAWLQERGERGRLLRLAATLGRFWLVRGYVPEGRSWLERALVDPGDVPANVRAHALVELGQLRYMQGEGGRFDDILAESIPILRASGDAVSLVDALVWQSWMAIRDADYATAQTALDEVLGLSASVQEPELAALLEARALANLGTLAHARGNLDTARACYERVLHIYREQGNQLGSIRTLRDLGDVARDRGDLVAAVASYRQCLEMLGEQGEPRVVVNALIGLADAAAAWGAPERAARLLGMAEAARERFAVGVFLPPEEAAHQRAVERVRAALREADLRVAWSSGRTLPIAAAVIEIRDLAPPASGIGESDDRPKTVLSRREAEVLALLASGKTDREIAEALFISVRTVEHHVSRILEKFGVRTRTAAVAAAIAAGVVTQEAPTRPPAKH